MNIRDVSKLENNIHAGIKYMRFIRDNYLADAPEMSEVDRHLFAFASYNAGPNRIAAMRRRAAAQGLDPNVWFQNVEVARREGDRPGDRSVREQHLQVLRGLQARAGEGASTEARRRVCIALSHATNPSLSLAWRFASALLVSWLLSNRCPRACRGKGVGVHLEPADRAGQAGRGQRALRGHHLSSPR